MDIKIYKEEQEDYTTVEEVIKKAFENAGPLFLLKY
ncbi:hypothetical protein U732_3440 [Clostridium argentinense CDC 2741]|uniref:Uncharacterized protein n=1 Tax=Clostridium argentinense CDC 2741 TaxID=1418104 RepID=A0A0C1UGQ7_9CLOT|nr:hypothetical protein U732_3440 [Clostridium argentinense CDC 2741]